LISPLVPPMATWYAPSSFTGPLLKAAARGLKPDAATCLSRRASVSHTYTLPLQCMYLRGCIYMCVCCVCVLCLCVYVRACVLCVRCVRCVSLCVSVCVCVCLCARVCAVCVCMQVQRCFSWSGPVTVQLLTHSNCGPVIEVL